MRSMSYPAIMLIAMAALPLPAVAAGALAVGFIPDGQFAWAGRDRSDFAPGTTAETIESAAIAGCRQTAAKANATGESCKIVLRYDDQCVAVAATTPSGHYGGWGKGVEIEDARRDAMAMCAASSRGSHESCRVLSSFCDK